MHDVKGANRGHNRFEFRESQFAVDEERVKDEQSGRALALLHFRKVPGKLRAYPDSATAIPLSAGGAVLWSHLLVLAKKAPGQPRVTATGRSENLDEVPPTVPVPVPVSVSVFELAGC